MNERNVQAALDQVVKNIANGEWGTTMFALITHGDGVYICLEGKNPSNDQWSLSLWKGCCDWDGLKHPSGPDNERITSIASDENAIPLNPGMEIVHTGYIKHGQRALLKRGDDGVPFVDLLSIVT